MKNREERPTASDRGASQQTFDFGDGGEQKGVRSLWFDMVLCWALGMPHTKRICPSGEVFYVLNRAVARLRSFEKPEDYAAFMGEQGRVLAEFPQVVSIDRRATEVQVNGGGNPRAESSDQHQFGAAGVCVR